MPHAFGAPHLRRRSTRMRTSPVKAPLAVIGLVAAVSVAITAMAAIAPLSAVPAAAAATSTGYTWGNVEVVGGGFVPGIVFNQAQKDLVYARTDIGGAYRLDPATQ